MYKGPANSIFLGNETICELSFSISTQQWMYEELVPAIRGTPIACTSYAGNKTTVYHVYYLSSQTTLCEYRSDRTRAMNIGALTATPLPPDSAEPI